MQTKYEQLIHAMQSGVAAVMTFDDAGATPKHLRVGVNSAMCDNAALVRLLIAKGIITQEEHLKAIEEEMAREVERYKAILREHFGKDIDLA